MSNICDMPGNQRPIHQVADDLRSIKNTLNTILIDTQNIKSDINEIKQFIKDHQNKEDQLLKSQVSHQDKGWFFTY